MRGGTPGVRRRMENALLHWPEARIEVAPGRGAGPVYTTVVGRRTHRSWREQARVRRRLPRRGYVRAAARCRRPPSLTRHPAGLPRRPAAPRNKGIRYPADPPTIEEIVTVMRRAGDGVHGRRLRGLIVVLWRAGLRICEALALAEADLDARRVRCWCGAARVAAAARSAWTTGRGSSSRPGERAGGAAGRAAVFCVVNGATRGRPWAAAAARCELRRVARQAGVRRRLAPHQLRHAHAVEMAREGVPLIVIQRQLGHTNSASPRSTSRASTAQRSSRRSTHVAHRWSP